MQRINSRPLRASGLYTLLMTFAASTSLSGCASTIDKLENAGKPPKLAEVANPTEASGYQPISWPMPETPPPPRQYANSLWQPGARAFFRDQRAARVGDILRVNIKIKDKAELNNETEANRDSGQTLGAPTVFGLENKLVKWLPGTANPAALLSTNSATNSKGTGDVKRKEAIETQVAALITQVLPNGNFVIDGKQEIRINNDIREVAVKGVVRPQDISSDNTIDSTQIAEARIIYGGRGQLSDMQQPRWGHQVIEAIAPF